MCSERDETSRLANRSNIYSMRLNPVNLMCRGKLVFGGTHPAGISGVRATEYKFPFRCSCLRTQVSLSWRDELQRHGPRGIAGDRVAELKFRRGDLCSGARRGSNEAGYLIEQTLLSLPSVGSPHLGTHASRCWRDHSSETRTPGGFIGPGHGTQASLSSRSKSSETRIRELAIYAGL